MKREVERREFQSSEAFGLAAVAAKRSYLEQGEKITTIAPQSMHIPHRYQHTNENAHILSLSPSYIHKMCNILPSTHTQKLCTRSLPYAACYAETVYTII